MADAASAVVAGTALSDDIAGGVTAAGGLTAAIEALAGSIFATGNTVAVGVGLAAPELVGINTGVVGVANPAGGTLLCEVALVGRGGANATLAVAYFTRRTVRAVVLRIAVVLSVAATCYASLPEAAAVVVAARAGTFAAGAWSPAG